MKIPIAMWVTQVCNVRIMWEVWFSTLEVVTGIKNATQNKRDNSTSLVPKSDDVFRSAVNKTPTPNAAVNNKPADPLVSE